MLKNGFSVKNKGSLYYIKTGNGRLQKEKPWISNSLSFVYDFTMKRHVFWKQFGTDIDRHEETMQKMLSDIHGKHVLELACGTGNASEFLPNDNYYIGTDISPGLLKRAVKRFKDAGFTNPEFYVANALDLPFTDNSFDACLCFLSLNFFPDAEKSLAEAARLLKKGGSYICAVPVPERKPPESTIRGKLYSEAELAVLFKSAGFSFESFPDTNGALLYFTAIR